MTIAQYGINSRGRGVHHYSPTHSAREPRGGGGAGGEGGGGASGGGGGGARQQPVCVMEFLLEGTDASPGLLGSIVGTVLTLPDVHDARCL